MRYRIEEVDVRKPDVSSRINDLFRLSFDALSAEKDLRKNTGTRNGKTTFFATFCGEEIVAFTAFMAHEILLNAQNYIAYQMCWGCTHPNHRGKGLFVDLINHSKGVLKERGAAFLFGYPNQYSYPVFVNKLDFREEEMRKVNIPLFTDGKAVLSIFLKSLDEYFVLSEKDVVFALQSELIDLKKSEHGELIRWCGSFNNVIWGKIRIRKTMGFSLRFFKVGGLICNKPHLLKHTLYEIIEKEKPHFLQFVTNKSNNYLSLFSTSFKATKVEPLVLFDLNVNTDGLAINFFNGMKDVF